MIAEKNYYKKDQTKPINISIESTEWKFEMKDNEVIDSTIGTKFYCRPSVRIVPEPKIDGYDEKSYISDKYWVSKSIYADSRFNQDVNHYTKIINKELRKPLFSGSDTNNIVEIRKKFIDTFNQSLNRVFGDNGDINLELVDYEEEWTNTPANLYFKKWKAERLDYKLLSHWEKQIIILLLNLILNKENLENHIIFIDEMDVHLHTFLQYNIIKEVVEYQLPVNSQLRTATHSLWFIQYAKDNQEAVVIDFDSYDFDKTKELKPEKWQKIFEIAVPEDTLMSLFKDKNIIYCEWKNDRDLNCIGVENCIFVWWDRYKDRIVIENIEWSFSENEIWIIDRDFLSDKEKTNIEKSLPRLRILPYYCFENVLYHPENIKEAYPEFDNKIYIEQITHKKNEEKYLIKSKLSWSRDKYLVFSERKDIKNKYNFEDKNALEDIHNEIDSDDFETFFKHFNMKQYITLFFDTSKKEKLLKTNRIKNTFKKILAVA